MFQEGWWLERSLVSVREAMLCVFSQFFVASARMGKLASRTIYILPSLFPGASPRHGLLLHALLVAGVGGGCLSIPGTKLRARNYGFLIDTRRHYDCGVRETF